MYVIDNTITKCSECGSVSFEDVRYGNLQFLRCRVCGHEGEKREIIPTPSKIPAVFKQSRDDHVRTF